MKIAQFLLLHVAFRLTYLTLAIGMLFSIALTVPGLMLLLWPMEEPSLFQYTIGFPDGKSIWEKIEPYMF